jgi:DNA repair protein RadC
MKYDILSTRTTKTIKITCPADINAALKRYANARTERFLVMTLNGAHEIIKIHIVSIGTVNRTMVHPREVFYCAIADSACAIVVSHNHPSGRTDASPEDRNITSNLTQAGNILGIPVLDHVIIGKNGYFSFVEHGLLDPATTE